eukprot:GHVT01095044.1.p1 GENE.GHVT01095044.1~~GHVT01095044.1.p1  ORF type:complete len:673 (+),score=132.06 GHVT01095044.1:2142-4160(+)
MTTTASSAAASMPSSGSTVTSTFVPHAPATLVLAATVRAFRSDACSVTALDRTNSPIDEPGPGTDTSYGGPGRSCGQSKSRDPIPALRGYQPPRGRSLLFAAMGPRKPGTSESQAARDTEGELDGNPALRPRVAAPHFPVPLSASEKPDDASMALTAADVLQLNAVWLVAQATERTLAVFHPPSGGDWRGGFRGGWLGQALGLLDAVIPRDDLRQWRNRAAPPGADQRQRGAQPRLKGTTTEEWPSAWQPETSALGGASGSVGVDSQAVARPPRRFAGGVTWTAPWALAPPLASVRGARTLLPAASGGSGPRLKEHTAGSTTGAAVWRPLWKPRRLSRFDGDIATRPSRADAPTSQEGKTHSGALVDASPELYPNSTEGLQPPVVAASTRPAGSPLLEGQAEGAVESTSETRTCAGRDATGGDTRSAGTGLGRPTFRSFWRPRGLRREENQIMGSSKEAAAAAATAAAAAGKPVDGGTTATTDSAAATHASNADGAENNGEHAAIERYLGIPVLAASKQSQIVQGRVSAPNTGQPTPSVVEVPARLLAALLLRHYALEKQIEIGKAGESNHEAWGTAHLRPDASVPGFIGGYVPKATRLSPSVERQLASVVSEDSKIVCVDPAEQLLQLLLQVLPFPEDKQQQLPCRLALPGNGASKITETSIARNARRAPH